MTRGRKKDTTLSPSRSLTLQRDYRARKAQYVADLEQRCRKAEQENVELRKQLELARGLGPTAFGAEIAELTLDLLQHLGAASASLLRFQQLTTTEFRSQQNYGSTASVGSLRPANFPSSSPSYPTQSSQVSDRVSQTETTTCSGPHESRHVVGSDNSHPLETIEGPRSSRNGSPSLSVDSECCGGFLDCHGLVEGNGSELSQTEFIPGRTSEMRSTSGSATTGGTPTGYLVSY